MDGRDIRIFIVASLVVGAVVGGGAGYLYYRSQFRSLDAQLRGLDARLDETEADLSMVERLSGDVDAGASAVQDIGQKLDGIEKKLSGIEANNRADFQSIETRLDDFDNRLESLQANMQNEDTIVDVYGAVSPAVVFITSTAITFDFQLQQEVPSGGVGSGVVVSPEGYIITNNHVVEGAEKITVSFKPGSEIEAEVIGTAPPTDLAVIKIDPPPGLPVATLGDSNKIKVGMTAIAIGNPFSLERTVTVGVVSSVNRTLDAETGDIIFGIIQTDASVNPGNSGGPLVNSKGEVIGINSAIISPVQGSVGIGFAIPINTAKKVMAQLIEKGRVSRPYIGISGGSTADFPPDLNLPEKGVLVIDVLIGSPADKAGLLGSASEVTVGMVRYPVGGDVITALDNTEINAVEDLLESLSKKDVGDTVTIKYLRNGERKTGVLILEERPEQ